MPPERHGQYLCHTVGPSTPLQQLEMGGTRLVGYARLIDRQGRVRRRLQPEIHRVDP